MVAAALLVGCGSFEDPTIVLDLRVLAMSAEPPEQVFDLDISNPTAIDPAPIEVCALVAEPNENRRLGWAMRLCPETRDLRCDLERPFVELASGTIDDPDLSSPAPRLCTTFDPGPELLPILMNAIEESSIEGFGGVDLIVELRVGAVGAPVAALQYAAKRVRFSVRLPAERTANRNPRVASIDGSLDETVAKAPLSTGRCADGAVIDVPAGGELFLLPVEPMDVREAYVVPTFDGGSRMFTEYMSYQWLATGGDWSESGSGGPRDGFGNDPELDTSWRAPSSADLNGPTLFSLWMIQRDERVGVSWTELCTRVTP